VLLNESWCTHFGIGCFFLSRCFVGADSSSFISLHLILLRAEMVRLLCVLFLVGWACDFQPGVQYTCIPCGGIYTCHGEGTCLANRGTVPGCSLPSDADDWFCCPSASCNVNADGMCSYTAPGGGSSGGSCPACQDCSSCQSACACTCGALGALSFSCSSVNGMLNSSCFCWWAIIAIAGGVAVLVIIIVLVVCACRRCSRSRVHQDQVAYPQVGRGYQQLAPYPNDQGLPVLQPNQMCRNCNAVLVGNSAFCQQCGTRIQGAGAVQ
jgi:hypothetical protein